MVVNGSRRLWLVQVNLDSWGRPSCCNATHEPRWGRCTPRCRPSGKWSLDWQMAKVWQPLSPTPWFVATSFDRGRRLAGRRPSPSLAAAAASVSVSVARQRNDENFLLRLVLYQLVASSPRANSNPLLWPRQHLFAAAKENKKLEFSFHMDVIKWVGVTQRLPCSWG